MQRDDLGIRRPLRDAIYYIQVDKLGADDEPWLGEFSFSGFNLVPVDKTSAQIGSRTVTRTTTTPQQHRALHSVFSQGGRQLEEPHIWLWPSCCMASGSETIQWTHHHRPISSAFSIVGHRAKIGTRLPGTI
jgi:hypothetical protein